MRDKGVVEGLQTFIYNATLATSRFDKTSHLLPSYQVGSGTCTLYATTPVPGCSANWKGGAAATSTAKVKADAKTDKKKKHKKKKRKKRRHHHHHHSGSSSADQQGAPAQADDATPATPNLPVPTPQVPNVPNTPLPDPTQVLNNVLDYLLGP
jgi:hypothetical protein